MKLTSQTKPKSNPTQPKPNQNALTNQNHYTKKQTKKICNSQSFSYRKRKRKTD
jgi:hypothetical protein